MSGPGLDEVTALLHRYARAVDSHDWELYRSVFTDDAYIDYGPTITAGSRDEVADWLAATCSAVRMSMHYITNVEILHGWRSRRLREEMIWFVNAPGQN